MTLEEVGEKFKVTRERVRQIQTMAIHKMRRILSENERQRSKDDILAERIEQKDAGLKRLFCATQRIATSYSTVPVGKLRQTLSTSTF